MTVRTQVAPRDFEISIYKTLKVDNVTNVEVTFMTFCLMTSVDVAIGELHISTPSYQFWERQIHSKWHQNDMASYNIKVTPYMYC